MISDAGEREVTRFRTQKTGHLLAYLAYHVNRTHTRESLVELLWPDDDEEAGRHNLRNAFSALRRDLEPPEPAREEPLLTDRYTARLNPEVVTTDVAAFEEALRRAEQALSRTESSLYLSEAVTLYRDELLPGCYDEWCLRERERLAELYIDALRRLTTTMEQAGDVDRAVAYARRALHADPLREESHLDLMRLLSVAGQLSSALRQYRHLETVFARELDERPSPRARELGSFLERRAARERPAEMGSPPLDEPPAPSRDGRLVPEGDGSPPPGDPMEWARALYGAGLRAHGRAEAAAARAFMEESVRTFRELGDRAGLAYSLCFLGSLIAETGGSYEEAGAPCEEGLAIFRELENRTGTAYALLSLGRISYEHGRLDAARPLLEENVRILREIGSRTHLSRALISLADVAVEQGDRETARRFYTESLDLAREARPDGIAWWLEELAEDCAARKPERAAILLGAGAALRQTLPASPEDEAGAGREPTLALLREALGEDAFQSAWTAGLDLSADDAVRRALDSP